MQVELDKLVRKCVEVEQSMADIYKAYMERFPEDASFWQGIYDEELKHIAFLVNADIFSALGDEAGQLSLPSEALVERALSSAQSILRQIKARAVPLEEALTMALQLEESVVEGFVGDAMADDGQGSPFLMLLNDTRSHADMIRNFMRLKGFIKIS